VGRERPLRWVLLIALALLVSGLEMVGAVLVYTLLALVADPDGEIDLPLVGDLRNRFDGVADDTLLLWTVAAMAVFFLVRAVVKIASKYVQARVAHNAGARLSTRLFEGYLRWPYPMHLNRTTSELIRNGHQAVMETIGQVVLPTIRTIAESFIVAGLLVVLVLLAPLATLAAVVVIGGTAVLLLLFVQPRLKALGKIRHREARPRSRRCSRAVRHPRREGPRPRAGVREGVRSKPGTHGTGRLPQGGRRAAPEHRVRAVPDGVHHRVLRVHGHPRRWGAGDAVRPRAVRLRGLRMQPSMQLIIQGLNSLKFAAAPLADLHRRSATHGGRRHLGATRRSAAVPRGVAPRGRHLPVRASGP
jgi:ATP-binding cassette, subfamily B, bacterial PglK